VSALSTDWTSLSESPRGHSRYCACTGVRIPHRTNLSWASCPYSCARRVVVRITRPGSPGPRAMRRLIR
jgi:hypothetical protein